jgi:hypothetical protein
MTKPLPKPKTMTDADKIAAIKALNPGISDADALSIANGVLANQASTDPYDRQMWLGIYPDTMVSYQQGGGRKGEEDALRGGNFIQPGGKPNVSVPNSANIMSGNQAIYWLQQQADANSKDYQRIRQEMIDAGMIDKQTPLSDILTKWASLVSLSINAYQNGANFGPEHYIGVTGALNAQNGPVTSTDTRTENMVTNATELAQQYQSVAQQALGRRASPAEAAAAAANAQAAQRAQPTVSTTTQTARKNATGGTATATSVSGVSGGVDLGEVFLENAMSSKDYGAYQAAGRLFPLLLNAVGAVNSAGS